MNTKQLLNERRSFLSENRIYSMHEIVQVIRDTRGEDDVDLFIDFWRNNRFLTKYTQVIKRELETTAESVQEILDTCKLHYDKIYQSAGPRDTTAIGSGSVSIDDLRKDIDSKKNFNKTEVRQQCRYANGRPVLGKYNDFNVFHSDNDWVVIEPKTIQGSIAWAHGKPDGTEETDQSRRVGWCTSVTTGNNMFPNYAGNLHMFYFIKSDYENVQGPDRRLCVSYINKKGKASIDDKRDATVNASNIPINKKYIRKIISEDILKKIEEVVTARKNTNFAEIYSKITLSQLLRQVEQMKNDNMSKERIKQELKEYCHYSKDPEVVKYCISKGVKWIATTRKDLLQIDPTGELIRKLANDEEAYIRSLTAERKDLLQIDPKGELIRKLANDNEHFVRSSIASRKDLLKVDPSGELIRKFASDKHVNVRTAIAMNKDLLKADPSGEIIRKLANDKEYYVRFKLALRKDLLKADPSGEIIRKLVNDKETYVTSAITSNIEYVNFISDVKESLIRSYIKHLIS
jgi:hypothetical protein